MIRHPHALKWIESLDLADMKKWVLKNSCLCNMAGECNGCHLSDAEQAVRVFRTALRTIVEADEGCDYRLIAANALLVTANTRD